MDYRIEHDTMGEVKVPADKYWGAQTQRSFENFKIGTQTMPVEVIRAFGLVKKAAALVNKTQKKIDNDRADLISTVCDEVIQGKLNEHFPLSIFQTGSGTQTNMNVNEVIANRGNKKAGKELLHPNDHVNLSQSSNDAFPTAMHVAAVLAIEGRVLRSIKALRDAFLVLEQENAEVIKMGRTHLQDAAPLTFGQEISGWRSMMEHCGKNIQDSTGALRELAMGGTAVGTGLNTMEDFDEMAAKYVSMLSDSMFFSAENKFHALTSKDGLVYCHGALKALAADLMKIANDVRWLASGPRGGLGEITIPANEPGSSIMPGKVNPTQCEALTMVAVQVMGNDAAIGFAASQGNFQLNTYMPVMIANFLESANLLADAMDSFRENCVTGIKANVEKMKENVDKSLMLVTALNSHIGYENAAKISKCAEEENISLKEAALKLELVTEEEFDQWVDLKKMTAPEVQELQIPNYSMQAAQFMGL